MNTRRILSILLVVGSVGVFSGIVQAAPIVIDNGDFGSGYAVSGVTEQGVGDAFADDQAFNNTSGDTSQNATYTFTGLANGIYDIFASWRQAGQANVSFMQVAASDGGPTAHFNQQNIGPIADLIINDGGQDINFQNVGQVTVSDTDLVVTTSLSTMGTPTFFINDAIAINLVPPLVIPEPSALIIASMVGLLGLGFGRWHRRRRRIT